MAEFIEYINAASIVVASLTAVYGISSWRREYRGKKRAELAEEALCLFYEGQDAIRHIRSPFSEGHEGNTREVSDHETPQQKGAFKMAYVLTERYNTYAELFNKLHAMRYRFMAQFGREAGKPFEDFRKILNTLLLSAKSLARSWAQERRTFPTNEAEKKFFDHMVKQEAVFWEGLPDEDPIIPKIEKCIEEIEKICKPIIDNKSWFKLTVGNIKRKSESIANKLFQRSVKK